jgi:hypothetical protein
MKTHYFVECVGGNHDTHKSKYFKRIFAQTGVTPECVLVDPFARDCPLAWPHTNDLNPNTSANHHSDALEFLRGLESNYFDGCILDPPFSDVANERIYDHVKLHGEKSNIYTDATYFKSIMMEIFRVLKPGGWVLRFGYTTSTLCKGFELQELWVINFSSPRNDVLVSKMVKVQNDLTTWS